MFSIKIMVETMLDMLYRYCKTDSTTLDKVRKDKLRQDKLQKAGVLI